MFQDRTGLEIGVTPVTDNDSPHLLDRIARWALVVGALAFGIFWEAALLDSAISWLDLPWPIALSIHGLSITTIAFGLILLERSAATGGGSLIGWSGVALVIIGTFASFVLLAVGLSLLAVSLWIKPGWRAASSVLIAGSITLLLSYLLGARVGTEDAPEPSLGAAILFGAAGVLIPIGLALISTKQASIARST